MSMDCNNVPGETVEKVIMTTAEYTVSWKPPGCLVVARRLRFYFIFALGCVLTGSVLFFYSMDLLDLNSNSYLWKLLSFPVSFLFFLAAVVAFIIVFRDMFVRYPIELNGPMSTAQIGRSRYRISELSNPTIQRINLFGQRLIYSLSVDVVGRKRYICRGVPEEKLASLQEVNEKVAEILRLKAGEASNVSEIEIQSSLLSSESFLVSTTMILTGLILALVSWFFFPEYQLKHALAKGNGFYIWFIGLAIIYTGILQAIGLPVWNVLQKGKVKRSKKIITITLLVMPWIAYFFYYII